MRCFSLYCRGKIWYAQIKNPATEKYMPGRSTGKWTEKAAERVADEWLQNGIPELGEKTGRPLSESLDIDTVIWTIRRSALAPADAERIVRTLKDRELVETAVVKAGPGAEQLVTFLRRFWDFEKSPYVREKLAHGHMIGRRHCRDMAGWIRTCWEPFFGTSKQLGEIRKSDLRAFSLWLNEERKLKAKSINTALSAGTVALRWAHAEELIPSNPAAGLGSPPRRPRPDASPSRIRADPWPTPALGAVRGVAVLIYRVPPIRRTQSKKKETPKIGRRLLTALWAPSWAPVV